MKGGIGCPTRIVTPVPPMRELAKGETKELSEKAKLRLKILEYYYRDSARFSAKGRPEVSLTCRHFGIRRSYFYRWNGRYDRKRLSSLENRPPVPKQKREPEYSRELVRSVRELREADPTYSGKKLRPILLRIREDVPSVATLGRLIKRESLYFRADTKRHRKRSKTAKKAHERRRKPYNLTAQGARQIIEFDMKHVYLLGMKHYAFCAIDPFTKEAAIHVACAPSSRSAKVALEKAAGRFGKGVAVINDNGSQNMRDAEAFLRSETITQYWTRPREPKEKPFVERLIGTLQKACLDYHYEPMNVRELSGVVDSWLDKYHVYRPHESLGFLTPAEYCATLGVSIPQVAGVS